MSEISLEHWQLEDVKKAISEADAGEFFLEQEVDKMLSNWLK
jgi:predicted transcriptional regulator